MARILITSGPTREYLDPVRFLTNGSSGRMGAALAAAALQRGFEVAIVSGPVAIDYPTAAQVERVTTTEEMLAAAERLFPSCTGAIGAAAPCDCRPRRVSPQKLDKRDLQRIELEPTPDVIGRLGQLKRRDQWTVAFALETDGGLERAVAKRQSKRADWVVWNRAEVIDSEETGVVLLRESSDAREFRGSKAVVARELLAEIFARREADRVADADRE